MPEFDHDCLACPRLASHLSRVRNMYPHYHARPVSPFGDPKARLLIIGLAPGMHGANRTGRPFTGDHAGILLYETLYRHGLADRPESRSATDGLILKNCRITNAVKCLPPGNKPLPGEIATCNLYLKTELQKMPAGSVTLALGTVAHDAVLQACNLKRKNYPFSHGAHYCIEGRMHLLDSYHCSRYNTQTKRLTAEMFDRIVARAIHLLTIAP